MVFFPSVVAPRVFRVLEPDDAGRFLRALFPAYYLYLIITAVLSAVFALFQSVGGATILVMVALSTLWVRESLMPRINAWRDAEKAGDPDAGAQFHAGHQLSVRINMVQLFAVIGVIVWVG